MQNLFARSMMNEVGAMAMECALFASLIAVAALSPVSAFWPV